MKKMVWLLMAGITLTLASSVLAGDGEETFKTTCAKCHGADGIGKTPVGKSMSMPDLATPKIQAKSDATLNDIVTNGFNLMPGFKNRLSATEIADVVKYLRTFKKK